MTPETQKAQINGIDNDPALRALLGDPGAADNKWEGLARLAAKLEHEQETAVAEPPPARRTRSTKS